MVVLIIIITIWELHQGHKRAYQKAVKDKKHKNKTACAYRLLDDWIVGDSKKLWNCFNNSSANAANKQGVGELKPKIFATVFNDNFLNLRKCFGAYNNNGTNRSKALKE